MAKITFEPGDFFYDEEEGQPIYGLVLNTDCRDSFYIKGEGGRIPRTTGIFYIPKTAQVVDSSKIPQDVIFTLRAVWAVAEKKLVS